MQYWGTPIPIVLPRTESRIPMTYFGGRICEVGSRLLNCRVAMIICYIHGYRTQIPKLLLKVKNDEQIYQCKFM